MEHGQFRRIHSSGQVESRQDLYSKVLLTFALLIDGLFGGWSPLHVEIIRFLVLLLFSLNTVFQTVLCASFFSTRFGCSKRNIGLVPAAANLPSEKATPL